MTRLAAPLLLGAVLTGAPASGQGGYLKPPPAALALLDAPPPPALSVSPTGEHVLLIQTGRYPPIADLARPMLRLAGVRFDPTTDGPARPPRVLGLTLRKPVGGTPKAVKLPAGKVGFPDWSPDGARFALTVTTDFGIELWVGSVETAELKKVPGVTVSAVVGDPVSWMPGSRALLVQLVPKDRGKPPAAPAAPPGPVVQESSGKAAPVRTYQDLLQNAHDEAVFDYHATSQLAVVDPDTGGAKPVGAPAVYLGADPSPNGEYLLTYKVKRPYSYLHPVSAFPRLVEVCDWNGRVVREVADLPLQDKVPIEGVPTGPRGVRWIPTLPNTLIWTEAQDGGDPKAKVPHRDALFTVTADGQLNPIELMKLEHRFAGLDFFPTGNRMLVKDYDRERKWGRTFLASTTALLGDEPKVLFDRSTQDRYGDPGTPLTRRLPSGHRVLRTTGDPGGTTIWLDGPGATPKGDRPFLDKFDAATGKATRVFHCPEGVYEDVVAILNAAGTKLILRRESPTEPANFTYRDEQHERPLTANTDPAPELRKVKKQLVTTKRADGVAVTFTLYLPPGHKDGDKWPAVFYAYPREFNTADTAGQVVGSPNRFTTFDARQAHLYFLTQGYAVMDEVSMPVVGPPGTANDTFIDQLVSTAKAAIDTAAGMGVDRDRVGVTGHSYGAFMTANLLAHSDLFRAGIARSGAYNRTLTPFGFQNERRTFWEAPEVYAKMSPFNHAEKLKEPILFIHGQADDNAGTFPVQSERMYAAVRGNGGTCRLVLLPHESHGYAARESLEHVLAESIGWFDRHVKAARPREK